MKTIRTFLACLFLMPICVFAQTTGQPMGSPEAFSDNDVEFAPEDSERRSSSMFHRARKDSPAEQLEYARALRDKKKYKKASKHYLSLVHTWHDSKEAPAAQREYAETLEALGRHEDAFGEYQYLIDHFSGSFEYEEVLDRQFRIANLIMTTKTRFLWVIPTNDRLNKALPLFEKIVINGPGWKKTPEAQFNMGWIYEQLEDYMMAIDAYELVEQQYRATEVAIASAFRKGDCLYKLAVSRPHEERGHQLARAHFRMLVTKYPEADDAAEAQEHLDDIEGRLARMYYDRALYYDKSRTRPKAALIAYSDFVAKFPKSMKAEAAKARMAGLEEELGGTEDVEDDLDE